MATWQDFEHALTSKVRSEKAMCGGLFHHIDYSYQLLPSGNLT